MTPETEKLFLEFFTLRQWAQDNIKIPEPARLAKRLNDITRRYSLGLVQDSDIMDVGDYMERIKEVKDEHEMKIGVIENIKPFYKDGEDNAVQSDCESGEESGQGSV